MAQTPFKGTVVDENGEPVIGASIIIVGTTTGTVTDFDGGFSLTAPEGSRQIKVSYVGMIPQTLEIKPDLKITLKADSQHPQGGQSGPGRGHRHRLRYNIGSKSDRSGLIGQG